jgi:hypothetical protein
MLGGYPPPQRYFGDFRTQILIGKACSHRCPPPFSPSSPPSSETLDFWEWHYWSGYGKDDAGKDYAIFFGSDPVGYNPATGMHAFMPNVISISPLDEGKKYSYFGSFPEFEARLPEGSTSKQDFEYVMKDSTTGWTATEQYFAMEERWTYKMDSGRKEDVMLDLEMFLEAPGYVSRTPTGIEDEGYNYRGSYNPQTMAGLR